MKEVDLVDHVYLSCTQIECQISKDIVDNYRNMFESRATDKLPETKATETWCRNDIFMVLWHGRSCKEVRGNILRTCEQNNSRAIQSRNSMHWRPSIQRRRRKWISWRNVHSLLTNCSYMWTWYFMVCEQTCSRGYTMDKKHVTNVWRVWSLTFITHVNTGNNVLRQNTAQQCRWGLFQDSDVAGDLVDSKWASGGALCVCGSHTFVPISWIFLLMQVTHGWDFRSWSLGFGYWSVPFFAKPTEEIQR